MLSTDGRFSFYDVDRLLETDDPLTSLKPDKTVKLKDRLTAVTISDFSVFNKKENKMLKKKPLLGKRRKPETQKELDPDVARLDSKEGACGRKHESLWISDEGEEEELKKEEEEESEQEGEEEEGEDEEGEDEEGEDEGLEDEQESEEDSIEIPDDEFDDESGEEEGKMDMDEDEEMEEDEDEDENDEVPLKKEPTHLLHKSKPKNNDDSEVSDILDDSD